MIKARWMLVFGAGLGFAGACVETTTVLDPSHCNSNDGDAFCLREHPDGDLPYCRLGTKMCDDAAGIEDQDFDGCVADPPEDACHSACGNGVSVLDDPECEGVADTTATTTGSDTMTGGSTPDTMTDTTVTATTGETETGDPTTDTETGDPTTDTGGCSIDDDCMDAATPFCDGGQCVTCDQTADPDGSCAGADAGLPVCAAGVCVQCSPEDAGACGGGTPFCDVNENGGTCVACTEHDQCPGTACHLDGPDAGACFEEAEVVPGIANQADLTNAFGALGPNDQAVFVLTGNDYAGFTTDILGSREVAIVSAGSATISGNSGFAVIGVSDTAILYLSNVTVGPNGSGHGIACSGTAVWLDDTTVSGNNQVGLNVSSGCAAHLRRSTITGNQSGGIVASGADVFLESTAVGENVDTQDIPGIRLTNGTFSAAYSSIVANAAITGEFDNIECFGSPTGEVRNSIIVAPSLESVTCPTLTFVNSAVDWGNPGATNVDVGYSASWFAPAEGDYHLVPANVGLLMDVAMWEPGDPSADVDGNPIPTDMPSFPGYDQP